MNRDRLGRRRRMHAYERSAIALGVLVVLITCAHAEAGAIGLKELSKKSQACVDCHKKEDPALYQQWGSSRHFRGNVGCYECHAAEPQDKDAYKHEGEMIAVIVSPKDCSRCHEKEVRQFVGSHHSKAGRILGSLDNVLAEVVEGNVAMKTAGFPGGSCSGRDI